MGHDPRSQDGSAAVRRPAWLRVRLVETPAFLETRDLLRRQGLVTVCEEAACPNLHECWSKRHATVMVLGGVCTRACAFCAVGTGRPNAVDAKEPLRLARAVAELRLRHVRHVGRCDRATCECSMHRTATM